MNNQLLLVSSYPTRNDGISFYTSHYIRSLESSGIEVTSRRVHFLRSRLSTFRWMTIAMFETIENRPIFIQYTPTAAGPMLPLALAWWRLTRKKVVLESHEAPSTYSKHLSKGWKRHLKKAYLWFEQMIVKRADAVIVHTRMHQRELLELCPRADVPIIPLPILEPETNPVRSKAVDWGFYGQISKKKGLDILLDCYQLLPLEGLPDLRILGTFAPGNSEYLQGLKSTIRPEYRNKIHFEGYLPESRKKETFSKLALLIFPYRWITQSAALAEACAHEVPFLASDLEFFSEFVADFGCGHLYPKDRPDELRQALSGILSGRIKFDPKAFVHAKKQLSLEVTTLGLKRILFSGRPTGLTE